MSNENEQANSRLSLYTSWWHRLTNSKLCQENQWQPLPSAHRAILKRCRSLDEVMLSEPFQALWQMIPEERRYPAQMEATALIAWALSSVKDDSEASLAKAMARKAGEGSDRPRVSTLRFQQLIKSRDAGEFSRRLRRILQQIGGAVSVQSLAREIESWYWQNRFPEPQVDPARRQVLRWAMDYYAATPNAS